MEITAKTKKEFGELEILAKKLGFDEADKVSIKQGFLFIEIEFNTILNGGQKFFPPHIRVTSISYHWDKEADMFINKVYGKYEDKQICYIFKTGKHHNVQEIFINTWD